MIMRRTDWLWLSGILAIALILRVIKLDAGLWYDEVLTLVDFVRLPTHELLTSYTTLNNHILYSLEAQGMVALFGESAWALRAPAVLFGVGSVWALWWLGSQVLSPWEARFSALLLAVSYHHIWFSQNARGYTGLIFWVLVATALFIRNIRRPSWASWVVYGFAVAVAMYTHLSAVFSFAAHGLVYLVLVARRHLALGATAEIVQDRFENISGLKPLFGFALGGALTLALYVVLIPQMIDAFGAMSDSGSAEVTVKEWTNPLWTILEVLRNLQELGFVMSVGIPAVLVFLIIGVISLFRQHPVFTSFFIIHIPLTLVILLALSFRIWPRYFFIDLGFIFLFLVHGVFVVSDFLADKLQTQERWRVNGKSLSLLASSAAVICSLFLLPPNYRMPKQDFLGARNFIEATRGPGDVVASVGLAALPFSKYYAPAWNVIETSEDLGNLRARGARTWLVYAFSAHTKVHYPEILEKLETDFELAQKFSGTLGDGSVYVYRSRTP